MVVKKNPSRLKKIKMDDTSDEEVSIDDILNDESGDSSSAVLSAEKSDADFSQPDNNVSVEDAHIRKLKIQETKDITTLRKLAADAKKEASSNLARYNKLKAKAEKLIAKAEKEKEKAEALDEKIENLKEKADMDREMAKVEEGSKAAKLKARAEKYAAKRSAKVAKADKHRAKAGTLREKAMKYKEEAADYFEKARVY